MEKKRYWLRKKYAQLLSFPLKSLILKAQDTGIFSSKFVQKKRYEHGSFLGCCLVFLLGKNKRRRLVKIFDFKKRLCRARIFSWFYEVKLRIREVCEAFSVPSFPSLRIPNLGFEGKTKACEAFFFPSHRKQLLSFLLYAKRVSLLFLRIGQWYLFFEGWYPKRSHYPKRRKRRDTKSFAYFSRSLASHTKTNSYPFEAFRKKIRARILCEGGIKASRTSCEYV